MTSEQVSDQQQIVNRWIDRLTLVEGGNYKDILEPATHIRNMSLRWVQPDVGVVEGIIKIDYLPDSKIGYLSTLSLYHFLTVFIDSTQVREIPVQSLIKIIYDALRIKLGNVTLSVTIEYSDAFDNTVLVALSSGDFPKTKEVEVNEDSNI